MVAHDELTERPVYRHVQQPRSLPKRDAVRHTLTDLEIPGTKTVLNAGAWLQCIVKISTAGAPAKR